MALWTSSRSGERQLAAFPAAAVYLVVACACAVLILLIRQWDAQPDTESVTTHGPLDAAGHLLTGLMIGVGVLALRLPIPLWTILLGSIAPDIGHLLNHYDILATVTGSSRTGTHSALALIVVASVGFIDRKRANVWLGIAVGGLTHLWRDMGTGTVPLLWPFDLTVDGTTYSRYMIALIGGTVAMIGSGLLLDVYRRANQLPPPD
jgi:membrane-bound metal-dependent hydrolase YbcI (DUF457 family)